MNPPPDQNDFAAASDSSGTPSQKKINASSNLEEWAPIGKRMIDEELCPSCEGMRETRITDIATCDTCGSKGYIGNADGVTICPRCEGMGEKKNNRYIPCASCRGHGKLYYIAQFFCQWIPCNSCKGAGMFVTENVDEGVEVVRECFACRETGLGNHKALYSHHEWRNSIEYKALNGLSEIVTCPACSGTDKEECKTCVGFGNVVRFSQYCRICEGRGNMNYFKPMLVESYCEECWAWKGRYMIELRRIKMIESVSLALPSNTLVGANEPVAVRGIASPDVIPWPEIGETWIACPGMKFCGIEPGSFLRKDVTIQPDGSGHLAREFEIGIDQGFWLSETPCTQSQWEAIMKDNPSYHRGKDHPVDSVSWIDARLFCEHLTRIHHEAGLLPKEWHFDLPTCAQWEYACRAGTTTDLNSGRNLSVTCTEDVCRDNPEESDDCPNLDQVAWYLKNSNGQTQPVGQKMANAWGLRDMHGNVFEMCLDTWSLQGEEATSVPWSEENVGPTANGGSFSSPAGYVDFDVSGFMEVDQDGDYNVGFRVAIVEDVPT